MEELDFETAYQQLLSASVPGDDDYLSFAVPETPLPTAETPVMTPSFDIHGLLSVNETEAMERFFDSIMGGDHPSLPDPLQLHSQHGPIQMPMVGPGMPIPPHAPFPVPLSAPLPIPLGAPIPLSFGPPIQVPHEPTHEEKPVRKRVRRSMLSVEEKKGRHQSSEQRRRHTIKESFDALSLLIQPDRGDISLTTAKRISKHKLLGYVVEDLQRLEASIKVLEDMI